MNGLENMTPQSVSMIVKAAVEPAYRQVPSSGSVYSICRGRISLEWVALLQSRCFIVADSVVWPCLLILDVLWAL